MTYEKLIQALEQLTREQKQADVTIEVDGEFYKAYLTYTSDTDVLDSYHPYLSKSNN